MQNINRLLESSKRSDVIGYNIYTRGKENIKRPTHNEPDLQRWDAATLGASGTVAIGHEIDKKNLVVPVISVNGKSLDFSVTRNRWTPAFMDTYYRCRPFGDYTKSGLLVIREKKCFTENDTFISHMTVSNDGREPITVRVEMSVPYDKISGHLYSVEAKIMPNSLKKRMTLVGYAAAKTSMGECAVITIAPGDSARLRYAFAFSPDCAEAADRAVDDALRIDDPFSASEDRFNAWMDRNAPRLEIENFDLLKIYYYRFFVIKSSLHTPELLLRESDFKGVCVYESPFGLWFGAPVGLPVPLQIEEMKWMKDKTAIRSNIANWSRGVATMQGYIQFTPMAIWHLYLQTGDKSVLTEYYDCVREYTLKKCATDDNALPVTSGSWITGAEYQPSFYQYTVPKWDWRHDGEGVSEGFALTNLYRADECAMYAANLIACRNMSTIIGKNDDFVMFSRKADAIIEKIKRIMWNENAGFFFDVDVESGLQCDEVYSYDGFAPMMLSDFGVEYHSVFDKLSSGERFDSGFSPTSVGKDCPMYWFDNCITGPTEASLAKPHSYGCSWNGPVWPFAVSLILDALGKATYTNGELISTFVRLFLEYTELHFDGGDRSTPCISEHYRPTDCASFSPYTEYFHSEWLNLFFSYYLGIRVDENGVVFNPITREKFSLDGVIIKGKSYRFSQDGDGLTQEEND